MDVRALLPTVRVPTLVLHHTDDPFIPPKFGKDIADRIPGAKYVELPGRNVFHFVEPWRPSFQEIAEFLTGQQADVADDRAPAYGAGPPIPVDSTRRAAEMGDRDWHALLDAHDAVVRAQLNRFRGREVNTSATASSRCSMARSERSAATSIRDVVRWSLGIEVRAGLHTGECEVRGDDIGGIAVHIGARVSALAGPNDVLVSSTLRHLVIGVRTRVRRPRHSRAQGRARRMAPLRRHFSVAVGFGETHLACRKRLRTRCHRRRAVAVATGATHSHARGHYGSNRRSSGPLSGGYVARIPVPSGS